MNKDYDIVQRTVYLLNPISGHGHLDSWARIFTAVFLKLGHRVILFSPRKNDIVDWLRRKEIGNLDRLHEVFPAAAVEKTEKAESLRMKVIRIYRTEGIPGIIRRLGYYVQRKWNSYWFNPYKHTRRVDLNFISPLSFTDSIKNCISKTQWSPDFIFILYLDMMTRDIYQWTQWEKQLPFSWGGIQFSPASNGIHSQMSLEPLFTRSFFQGCCFLLEDASLFYKNQFPRKVFSTIPDITDVEQLPTPSPLMVQVLERAAGRTIVFAGGTLDVRKGLSTFAQVIFRAPAAAFFFLVVGRLYWESFDAETATLLHNLFDNPPENVCANLKFIEDEREFTSLMGLADIIYAVYNNFPYSSNMLSKAAQLERPLIVSDGYEMGRRVKKYGLGITVPEGDVDAILTALSEVRQKDFSPTNFASYRKNNSIEVLERTLQEFLSECLDGAS